MRTLNLKDFMKLNLAAVVVTIGTSSKISKKQKKKVINILKKFPGQILITDETNYIYLLQVNWSKYMPFLNYLHSFSHNISFPRPSNQVFYLHNRMYFSRQGSDPK